MKGSYLLCPHKHALKSSPSVNTSSPNTEKRRLFFIKEEITALFFISKHFLLLLFQRNIYLYCMNFMPSGLLLTSIYAKTRRKTGISAHERAKTSLKILPPLTKLLLQYCKNHQKEMIDTITCYYWYSREETIQKPGSGHLT